MSNLFNKAQGTALELALNYVLKDPARNLPRLVDAVEKLDVTGEHAHQLDVVRPMAADPENNWNQFVVRLCEEIDHDVLKTTVRNFFLNASVLGLRKQAESREKYGCNVPWAILMDPTSACNLHCTGCWAAEYGNKLNMSYEELDSIINQANELGTYFFLSTPTAITSPAPSSTIPTPTSAPTPCWRPSRPRCSPPTRRVSPGTAISCGPALCWTTRRLWWTPWSAPAPTPPTCNPRRTSATWRPSARKPPRTGP